MKVLVTQSCLTLCNPQICMKPARLLCPCNSPGKITGVGSHSLLQETFLTLGSNPGVLHCRQFPSGSHGKESACQGRRLGFDPWVWKISWKREWLPTPLFLSGEFHGQRSLKGYSPQGCKKAGHDLATKQQSTGSTLYFPHNNSNLLSLF